MHAQLINGKVNIGDYFLLLKNLSINEKLKLISKISDSISEKDEDEIRFYRSFGKFQSSKKADELIDFVYSSRHFNNKNIQL
jgi:hypothetical protein